MTCSEKIYIKISLNYFNYGEGGCNSDTKWKENLKGVTIYRDGSRFPILSTERELTEFQRIKEKEFKIKSTPSFIINGNLLQGNKSIKAFRQIIDKILSE